MNVGNVFTKDEIATITRARDILRNVSYGDGTPLREYLDETLCAPEFCCTQCEFGSTFQILDAIAEIRVL